MCQMSFVVCHMSHITCHMSHVSFHNKNKILLYIFWLTNWCSYLVEGLLLVILGPPCTYFFNYLVPGNLAYRHILLCHYGDNIKHQITDIAYFLGVSFILITLSSSAITILLSFSLCGNPPLSHTFATSSTT